MKLATKVLKVLLLLVAGAIALVVVLYCFGPMLPAPMRAIQNRFGSQLAYGHGWLDASFDAALGRTRYSFDHLPVVGIADYARASNSIGEIEHDPNDSAYIAGYNRRMTAVIRKKFGADFPDGYVRRYLSGGWVDLILSQPTRCPIHRLRMAIGFVPIQDRLSTFGATELPDENVAAKYFPYAGMAEVMPPTFVPRPSRVRTRVCPACTEAEVRWVTAQRLLGAGPRPGA